MRCDLLIILLFCIVPFIDVNAKSWYDSVDSYSPNNKNQLRSNECSSEGYFADPKDCKRFYRCVDPYGNKKFVKHDFECPPKTLYDMKYNVCNHPGSATTAPGCSKDSPGPPLGESEKYCHYELFVNYLYTEAPDGVQKRIIAFNNTFPGPMLKCTRGKIMLVKVTNLIQDQNEPTSIHWHGIEQNLSPFYDGPESITQCPIVRNSSMIYEFQLFQAGTYWYHSHHSYQYVDGAWGPLIVRNIVPPTNHSGEIYEKYYDEEIVITINDWHHCNARDLSIKWLESPANFPRPDSTLINGRGEFDCSKALPLKCSANCDPSKQGPALIKVYRGKTYRIRIINTSASQAYTFSIDNHRFMTIETDGVDTVMVGPSDLVDIHVAQRYSILVTINQTSHESFWINAVSLNNNTRARAIFQYVDGPVNNPPESDPETALPNSSIVQGRPSTADINWDQIISQGGLHKTEIQPLETYEVRDSKFEPIYPRSKLALRQDLPTTVPTDSSIAVKLNPMECFPFSSRGEDFPPSYFDHQFILNFTALCSDGTPGTKLCFNGKPFKHGNSMPALFQMIKGNAVSEGFRPIYTPKLRDVIEIVINNSPGGIHPWHFHGHTFWLMKTGKQGEGIYKNEVLNANRTVRRDTTHTNPNSHVVIRYVVDNPGAWIFHCHINWHLEAGLGVTFIEAQELAKKVYSDIPQNVKEVCRRAGVELY